MKQIIKTSAWWLVVGLGWLTACQPAPLQPAQRYITFKSFTQLDIGSGFAVEIQQGPTRQISLTATADQQKRLEILETGETLSIHIQGDRGKTQPRLQITMPVLNALTLEGQTQATAGEFDLTALQLRLLGSSTLTVNGAIGQLTATVAGGSTYDGYGAPTQQASVVLAGGSQARIRATQKLNVTATGGSVLRYKGAASMEQNLSGGSQLIPE